MRVTGVLPAVPLSRPLAAGARPVTLRPRLTAGLPCSVVGDRVEKSTHNRITGLSAEDGKNLSVVERENLRLVARQASFKAQHGIAG